MNQPFFLHQYAKDFEAFCENVRNWDLEYHQLENGHFKSELLLFGDDNTQFTHASIKRMMKQHGSSPQGLMTFGILANPSIKIHWRNIDITGDMLFVFPENGELNSVTQSDFDVYVISLNEEAINQACEKRKLPSIKTLIGTDEAFSCSTYHIAELRHWLQSTAAALTSIESTVRNKDFLRHIQQASIEHLLDILTQQQYPVTRNKLRKRDTALMRAEEHIHRSKAGIITLSELCDASNVSERTLEYAFHERYDMPPKTYILNHRLNSVHKQLRSADPETGLVSRIAHQHGFWHMGKFSSDYKRLFAEKPSQTLKQHR